MVVSVVTLCWYYCGYCLQHGGVSHDAVLCSSHADRDRVVRSGSGLVPRSRHVQLEPERDVSVVQHNPQHDFLVRGMQKRRLCCVLWVVCCVCCVCMCVYVCVSE